jgi:nucleotide-binding universal stress UspA family protein
VSEEVAKAVEVCARAAKSAAPSLAAPPTAASDAAAPGDDGYVERREQARTSQVTLLTGDRVQVTRVADGQYAVDVTPAERPGRTPSFLTIERDCYLHVIHEYDSYARLLRIIGKQDMDDQGYRDQVAHEEQFQLAEMLAPLDTEGLPLVAKCLDGNIGQEAVDYAQEHEADLLVIPAPDHLGFWDRFFKHPTETVLDHLPCSLMLYRMTKGDHS